MKDVTRHYERSPKMESPKRACHDCGKPTTDYRCPQCRYKWAKKHGVVLDDVGCHGRGAL